MSLIVSHDAFQTLVRTLSEIAGPDSVDFRPTAQQELPGEAGYIAGHPEERAVRECLFFVVWSCPQQVLAGNLRELSCAVH